MEEKKNILTYAGDCCIGRGQFQVCHTVGKTAQSSGLLYIGEDLAVDHFLIYQVFESQIQKIVETDPGGDLGKTFYSHHVDGLFDRIADRCISVVRILPVVYRTAVFIFIGLVHISSCQSLVGLIKSRTIGG